MFLAKEGIEARRLSAASKGAAMKCVLGLLLMVIAVAGCSHHPSDAEKRTVSELTASMNTQGVGRYLIDLPTSWRFGDGDVTLYYGLGSDFKTVEVSIVSQGVTPAQFQAAVNWRAQRIQDVTNEETHRPLLVGMWPVEVRVDGDSNRQAVLLRYYDDRTLDNYHDHEIHLLLGDTYVLLKAESFKGVITPVEDRLKTLATQIFRVNDPARAGTGFILGPIIIRGTQDHEQAKIKFYDPRRTDITFTVSSSAVTPDESRHLLQRHREGEAWLLSVGAKLHKLRAGERAFAGMQGEEVLSSSESSAGDDKATPIHELLYAAETYRPDPGLMKPTLTVKLETGGKPYWDSDETLAAQRAAPDYAPRIGLPNFIVEDHYPPGSKPEVPQVTSSLTDYEATTLWDAILPTIRQRPGAAPSPNPNINSLSPISPEQAARVERDRRALDAFIASTPTPLNQPRD